jgi:hypothetical protein
VIFFVFALRVNRNLLPSNVAVNCMDCGSARVTDAVTIPLEQVTYDLNEIVPDDHRMDNLPDRQQHPADVLHTLEAEVSMTYMPDHGEAQLPLLHAC